MAAGDLAAARVANQSAPAIAELLAAADPARITWQHQLAHITGKVSSLPLVGLGPAFGIKFLYFCSPPGGQPALILDRLMSRWLRDNAGLALNEIRWSVSTYRQYLTSMYGWAGELAVASDELEMCIFSEQSGQAGSQWA